MNQANIPALAPKRTTAFVRSGKHIVQHNFVIKHGLFATDKIFVQCLGGEERRLFYQLRAQIFKELEAEGAVETMLAEKVAISFFRYLKLSGIAQELAEHALYKSNVDGSKQPHESIIFAMERLARIEAKIEKTGRMSLEEIKKIKNSKLETQERSQ